MKISAFLGLSALFLASCSGSSNNTPDDAGAAPNAAPAPQVNSNSPANPSLPAQPTNPYPDPWSPLDPGSDNSGNPGNPGVPNPGKSGSGKSTPDPVAAGSSKSGFDLTQMAVDRSADQGIVEAADLSKSNNAAVATNFNCASDAASAIQQSPDGITLLNGSRLVFNRDLAFKFPMGAPLYMSSDRPSVEFACGSRDEAASVGSLPSGVTVKKLAAGQSANDTLKFSATDEVTNFKGSHRTTISCSGAELNSAFAVNGITLRSHSAVLVLRDNEYDAVGMVVKNPLVSTYAVYICE